MGSDTIIITTIMGGHHHNNILNSNSITTTSGNNNTIIWEVTVMVTVAESNIMAALTIPWSILAMGHHTRG